MFLILEKFKEIKLLSISSKVVSIFFEEENESNPLKQNIKLKDKKDYEEWFLPISLHLLKEKQASEETKFEKI